MRKNLRLLRDQRGTTTVEFALIGLTTFATIVFMIMIGLVTYLTQVVDTATAQAGRQILNGSIRTQATSATLESLKKNICNQLPVTLSCDDLIVNLYVVPEEREPSGYFRFVDSTRSGLAVPSLDPGAGTFDLGDGGKYQYLQVIYPITFLPPLVASWMSGGTTYKGKPAYLVVSGAAFRNERS